MPGGPELSEKVPDEIFQLVESFKKFVREQKAYRDQKYDVDPILEVEKETEDCMLALQRVSVESDTNSQLIQQIKQDTTKLLRHAELAYSLLRPYLANTNTLQQQQQHQQQQQNQFGTSFGLTTNNPISTTNTNTNTTLNTNQGTLTNNSTNNNKNMSNNISSGSFLLKNSFLLNNNSDLHHQHQHNQFANTTTSQYFAELAEQFESRMRAYGEQIKELKLSMDSVIRMYNADELFKWLKKQHEALGETAAKVYMTHEQIMEKQSELDRTSSTMMQNNLTKSFNFTTTSTTAATAATTMAGTTISQS